MRHKTEYFMDEVRNGFYVPTAIKQAWAGILDVLKEIDDICRRHDIKYFADWGTMLGAVRHGGFIPWDDDLDICMLRDDYTRFRQVADAELPSRYVIHDFERKDDHWMFLSRVVSNERICFDEDYLNEHYNFPYLACVDIFVMDYLYRDEEKEKARDKEIMDLISMSYGLNIGKLTVAQLADWLAGIGSKHGVSFSDNNEGHRVERELYRLAQALMSEVSPEDADEVGLIFPWVLKGAKGIPKKYYETTVRLPFEDITVPVHSCYNRILSGKYGSYCQVHKGGGGHDYPFFEGQKRDLEKVNGAPLPGYSFDPQMLERNIAGPVSDEILFLPTSPSRWEGFSSLYKNLKDEGADLCVVPLPVMRKNIMGEITATDEEILEQTALYSYPEEVEVTDWLSYDISVHRPREIYIQDPYDEQNPVLTVPPAYYASVLRFFTRRLIFVPVKKTSDFGPEDHTDQYNLKHYLTAPGIIYSDVVYAYSRNLKTQYVNALTAFSGEAYRPVWEQKIVVMDCPEQCCRKQEKKKLFYGIGLNEIAEQGEGLVEAVKDRLLQMSEVNASLSVSVGFYPSDYELWRDPEPALCKELWDMVEKNVSEYGFEMVRIDPARADDMAADYDAYYGSPTPMVPAFTSHKKPVMLADYSI